MKTVVVLGATGSIGKQALEVLAHAKADISVYALTAHRNVGCLFDQCCVFKPKFAVLTDHAQAKALEARLKAAKLPTQVYAGSQACVDLVQSAEVDAVIQGIVGSAGLASTFAAANAGKTIYTANKESLVMGGHIFMETLKSSGAQLYPLDSEHQAVMQCLPSDYSLVSGLPESVTRITLTASGGPFRTRALNTFDAITPEEACAHPTWSMGEKISVDCATMVNKALELIEAHYLFGCDYDMLNAVIHPQSQVHASVTYACGKTLAQAAPADMRLTIAHGLGIPAATFNVPPIDWVKVGALTFDAIDAQRYPAFYFILEAAKRHPGYAIIANAANEALVQAFLKGTLPFTGIAHGIEQALMSIQPHPITSLEAITDLHEVTLQRLTEQGVYV